MAVIPGTTETFESGSNGTTIPTSPGSIFDAITGTGTSVYSDASPFVGSLCATVVAASSNRSLEATHTAKAKAWYAFALRINTSVGAVAAIANTYLAGVLVGNLRLNTNRTLNFRDVANSRWTSVVLTAGAWYEIRMLIDAASDIAQVKIYDATGALVEASPNLTLSGAAAAQIDEIRMGILTGSTTGSLSFDRITADDTDEPAVAPHSTPYLYYDNGSAWYEVSGGLYYDNGSSWVPVVVGDIAP